MKINVGSTNNAKLEAVRESIAMYPQLAKADIKGFSVASEVSEQPIKLEETVRGAMNRARNAYSERECDYSIGLESGLIEVPYSKSGFMDLCACVIYDGKEFHLGLSSAWEFPKPEMMDLVSKEGLTMTEAATKLGYANDPQLGAKQGMIGILTKGRLVRKEYTKQALTMALIHLDN